MSAKRTVADKDIAQELFLDSDSEDELTSHDSDSDQDDTQWTDNKRPRRGAPVIHRFTWGPSGMRQNQAPTVNKHSTPLSVFMLFFWILSLDEGWSPLPDVTLQEMYSFVGVILQIGHDIRETLSVLEYIRTIQYVFLRKDDGTKQVLPYAEIPSLHRQQR
jgi:hypothetical protein